jgi:hypothetical protein
MASGARLLVDVEGEQVALVVRDRACRLARTLGVLLDAALVGVVVLSGGHIGGA